MYITPDIFALREPQIYTLRINLYYFYKFYLQIVYIIVKSIKKYPKIPVFLLTIEFVCCYNLIVRDNQLSYQGRREDTAHVSTHF